MSIQKPPRYEIVLLFVFLISVFFWLISQLHLFYIPDSDFFGYLSEGKHVLHNLFDQGVVAAPLYSSVVYLFEELLPIRHSGIVGGTIFNIFCFIASLYYMWNMLRRWYGLYTLLPFVLFVANPLVPFINLQPLNLPLAMLLVFMIMYYDEKHKTIARVFMLLAYVTRPESIVVVAAYAIRDFIVKKRFTYPAWVIIGFCVVTLWYMRPVLPSKSYIGEILSRREEIPNYAFLRNSFVIAPLAYPQPWLTTADRPFQPFSDLGMILLISSMWILIGGIYIHKSKHAQLIPLFWYVVGYSVIHVVFPDKALRYSYPIVPFVYILFFWPVLVIQTHKISVLRKVSYAVPMFGLAAFMAFNSWNNTPYFLKYMRWDKPERRVVAEWLNKNVHDTTMVYAFEYWVSEYYSNNSDVVYVDTVDPESWITDLCKHQRDVYIVLNTQTYSDGSYFDYINGLNFFKKIQQSEHMLQNFTLIETFKITDRVAAIYKFHKPSDDWCMQFALK